MPHQARDFGGRTPSVLRRPAILLGPGRRELMPAAALPGPPRCPRRRAPASGDVNRAISRSHPGGRPHGCVKWYRQDREWCSPIGAQGDVVRASAAWHPYRNPPCLTWAHEQRRDHSHRERHHKLDYSSARHRSARQSRDLWPAGPAPDLSPQSQNGQRESRNQGSHVRNGRVRGGDSSLTYMPVITAELVLEGSQ
jgi:hypothetical protein